MQYADFFTVCLNYIFGRIDNPQGRLYECHFKIAEGNDTIRPSWRGALIQITCQCEMKGSGISLAGETEERKMTIERITKNNMTVAHILSDKHEITDVRSALDLAMSIQYEAGTNLIAISKDLICEDFFILSRGLAGEILQKYMNYHFRIAIYGEYSHYTSKPLHDFMYESNKGHDVFFAADIDEAVRRLTEDTPGKRI